MSYAVITDPVLTVYGSPCFTEETEKGTYSAISDEMLFGTVCRVLSVNGDWAHIISHYGYAGYVLCAGIREMEESNVHAYLSEPLKSISAAKLDIMNLPTVRGAALVTLPRGAAVIYLGESGEAGWAHVRLYDRREGFAPEKFLTPRLCADSYLFRDPDTILADLAGVPANRRFCRGGDSMFSFKALLDAHYGGSEDSFRTALTGSAMSYLGTQYRWGGRSPDGIDCSGLVHSAYLSCGAEIFRDASIADGWPMERIEATFTGDAFRESSLHDGTVRPGDALYFPGHVAMYLGGGKYIHSTAKAGSNGVVINSLLPGDKDFRADLLKSLYAVGGLRL